jgi:Ca-activated chloride channel family protein
MTFAYEELLWVAGLAPVGLLLLFLYDRVQRRRLATRLGELPVIGKVMVSASPRRRIAKLVLVQLGIALVLVAAARPQVSGKRKVELRGLDVVIAVDVSKSMMVDDVEPTLRMQEKSIPASRLGRARELAAALIEDLEGDRVGPVVFAGAASHFPVTEDKDVAVRFLYDLGPADLPPGSNMTEVFRVSRCLLRTDLYDDLGCARLGRRGKGGDPLPGEKSLDPDEVKTEDEPLIELKAERGKAMVIFTDGGDSDEETMKDVAVAKELGIAVILVGVGSVAGGTVNEIDYEGKRTNTPKVDKDGNKVISKRDDASLRLLAKVAGAEKRYFVASEKGEVDPTPIVEELRTVNRGLATKSIKEMRDIYEPFLFVGFMLLVIEAAISTRRRRNYPEEQ